MPGKTNESTRDWLVCDHLGDTIVDTTEKDDVEEVGDEQAARTSSGKAIADGDEERCTDRATDGQKLNLSVTESSMKRICIADRYGAS